ncbi:MAG: GDP-mannose 4,6-dehydratase [Anaerolineae bacterium]|nr:GDP-mannose 4,6-dehydratase [Anaerolineae bacterium]
MAQRSRTLEGVVVENSFWQGRRVFVTGATGMVGTWLVKELLATGAFVVTLIRDADPQSELFRSEDYRRTTAVYGRLEDFATLERAINEQEIDTVFHLGAQPIVGVAHRSPLPTFEANIRGSYNLLEACRIHPDLVKRIVIASSDKAYGTQPVLPYTEDMPLQGQHPYEVSKSCTDLLAQTYYHTYQLPVAIARCGNIYGGGDLNWSRIVPGTIRALLRGERPVIRSDGTFVRDYVYVKDIAQAYMTLAEQIAKPAVMGQSFNFGPESPLNVLELVDHLRQIMDCNHLEPDIQNTAQGEIKSQYLDTTKAHSILNWKPHYSLVDGLAETVAWYREFLAYDAG